MGGGMVEEHMVRVTQSEFRGTREIQFPLFDHIWCEGFSRTELLSHSRKHSDAQTLPDGYVAPFAQSSLVLGDMFQIGDGLL